MWSNFLGWKWRWLKDYGGSMNRIGLLIGAVALTLLTGCGSDKKITSTESSSGTSGSSSATAISSSSIAAPSDTKAATLADIPRLTAFPDEVGEKIVYIFGKGGMYSKLFLTSTGGLDLQAVGFFSLDTSGGMTLTQKECLGTQGKRDTLCVAAYLPSHLAFRMKGDTLLGGLDNSHLAAVTKATVTVNPVRVTSYDAVVGSWSTGTTSDGYQYEFYPNYRYVRRSVSGDTVGLETGIYDVQKDYLVALNKDCYSTSGCYVARFFAAVKKSDSLLMTIPGSTTDTLLAGTALDSSLTDAALVGTWIAKVKSGNTITHTMSLEFSADGYVQMLAYDASSGELAYSDVGGFNVLGPWLTLDMNQGANCSGNGTMGLNIGGSISCYGLMIGSAKLVTADSLTFNNSYLPTGWKRQ